MTTLTCEKEIIRPVPVDAYCEPELARMIGKHLLTITTLSGTEARWYRITLMDIDTDDIIAEYRYRLDLSGLYEPFFTGVLVDGDPLMFDPAGGYVFSTDWGDHYAERNQAESLSTVVDAPA